MLEKLKTIIWFIKNPQYIPQVFQVLKRKKNAELELSSKEATNWCQQNCISQNEALNLLTDNNNVESLENLFPEEIKQARTIAENCPVKMGGEGAISLIYHLVKEPQRKFILETGVAYGWSSMAILLAIKDKENAKLISNDMPYVKMNNDDYVGCIIPENLKSRWELQRSADIKGIPLALKKFNHQIDVCHYDSDKSYTGRMWASPLIWNALNKGGLFISDDINDNLSFKHFAESVNRNPIIIEHLNKYVGIIVK